MRAIDMQEMEKRPGIKLGPGDRFQFRCHRELACFNRCCRNLNLFLYPYDVIRLKQRLGIGSDVFIDRHVHAVLRPGSYFPDMLLRMSEDEEHTCPFLTPDGCSVYPDRPDACRTFPVEQGLLFHDADRKPELVHFFRPPSFCLGRFEDREMTVDAWVSDQEAREYNRMTALWAELKALFRNDPWGTEGPEGPRSRMAIMAAYNMDRFREFLFGSSFLKRYKVPSALLKKMETNDVELMKFGFTWIKFYLWGIGGKSVRPR
ncbi:MAG: YkgJ family cysteine cluster protein [Thermodesulfobacteriota bacterium]